MRDFREIPAGDCRRVKYILHDIDDTITDGGKLGEAAYSALWKLFRAGIKVIPATGRPAGWCDLIVREWPVFAVIGENGAFVNYFEYGKLREFLHPSVAQEEETRRKLEEVQAACLKAVPGCRGAKDQFSRRFDLAIDFGEDEPKLGFAAAERIRDVCLGFGAEAKISSIHVNAWFGHYDKLSMARLFLGDICGEENIRDSVIFFGDSPNDEPMFYFFPKSCGVANIRDFEGKIKALPAYIIGKRGGEGFAEAVDILLEKRYSQKFQQLI
ncbi:MAG: HAD-IIB family hydrolase [Oscillospiraceae bacterium]|jgi:HAD superfamily hydrolase (TIGR01484 family)|nr:HAD-IIB family hydrolase [Oscillospiraceae bacterium]